MSAQPYRVLITGSRSWHRAGLIELALTDLLLTHGALVVVHGACRTGADAIASAWAKNAAGHGRHVAEEAHLAEWDRYDNAAGPIRNWEMVEAGADVVLAFIRNGSPGATHCAEIAERAGIPVRRIPWPS